ncbi:hypothetical protein [Streptomyces sp. S.PB5]|uniref:hypothetical protein n=1 Tax=Streptomyces sp. S.PB5 TaxID=3020844 RepID=UPI0025B1A0D7|nr:hypothetical protein [Streptomyces sp. S.PB5]MDN3028400.1 hypothetical protein [Streptomyces sp. S.PB5]
MQRDPGTKGFTPAPKRWIVEQTFGTLLLHRRPARDYETLPAGAASWFRWSMTDVMTRRLTGRPALTWRDPPPIGAKAPTGEAAHA